MKYAYATLMILITALFFGGCAASDSSAPLPNFQFNFDDEDTNTSGEEGSTEEEGGGEEGGAEPDAVSDDAAESEDVSGDAEGNESADGVEGDTTEEPDVESPDEDTEEEEEDTTSSTEGGTTEGGEEIDLCDFVDPPTTTKFGVCKNTVKCDCEDGQYTCNYNLVPNHELFETTCDGLDNDCDGAIDEGLVDIDASTCPNDGVCKNSVFAFCHMGAWYCDYGLAPSFEFSETLCDGLDNDCDGQTDESVSFDSVTCKSEGVCAGNAQPVCQDGSIVCDYSNAGILYQEEETRCDSLDNDCDGSTDEIELTGLTPDDCDPGSPQFSPCCETEGVCSGKTSATCSQGSWTCNYDQVEGYEPNGETFCDGLDNDCDGEKDEAEHLDSNTSDCSKEGVCAGANPICDQALGQWDCALSEVEGYEPDDETTCDNEDNDCDGEVDEGITGVQGVDTTVCPNEGVCNLGVSTICSEGIWTCDFGLIDGYEEVELSCDSQDNDCDGETDEELTAPTGEAEGCDQFGVGVCTQFVALSCEDGVFSCSYDNVPLYQEEETACDGLDNDCDGETDELLNDPMTSECLHVGVCSEGVVASCQNQQWFCFYNNVQGYETVEITCDGKDNDCDGQTDEGLYDPQESNCKLEGVCTEGVQAGCVSGGWLCDYSSVPNYSGEDEYVCDGLDNDCDGTADEFVCQTTEPCTEDIQCEGNKCRATPGGGDSFCTEGTQCVLPLITELGVELVPSNSTACLNSSTYQTCVAGTWTNTIQCPEETPVCSGGNCLTCAPSSLDCENAENRVSCDVFGQSYEAVGGCANGEICVGGGYCVDETSGLAGGLNIEGSQEGAFLLAYEDGSVLMGWTDLAGTDSDGAGIYDRKFLQNGNPQGVESAVTTVKLGDQTTGAGVAVEDEAFLAWMDYSQGGNARVLARRVTNIGDPSTPTAEVSPADSQHHANPRVTRLVSGNVVVIWETGPTSSSQNTDISGRLFDAEGNAITSAFSVNSIKTGQQTHADVVSLIDGRFIVVWESHDSGNAQIVFQRFKSDGSKQGSQITVNQAAGGDQTSPRAAVLSDGRIAFAFLTDNGVADGDRGLRVRYFNSGGIADGPEQIIGNDADGDHIDPAITAVSSSGLAVGATTQGDTNGFGTVRIYRYDLAKSSVGDAIVLAENSSAEDGELLGNQGQLAMVGTDDNRLVVGYTDATPGDASTESEVRVQFMEFDYGTIEVTP